MEPEENEDLCPIDCPNRGNVLILDFGKGKLHLDFIELLLYGLILSVPVQISIVDAFSGRLNFEQAQARIVAITALTSAVRFSPTNKFSKWLQSIYLFKPKK